MKIVFAIAGLLLALPPAYAQTLEDVKSQLDAQRQINRLLQQRIETLEAQLAGRKIPPPERDANAGPEISADDPEADRALQRALERRGSAVLPPNTIELTPSLFWRHSGSDTVSSTDDIYGTGFDARIGLPGGWMLGVGIPYLHREIDSIGNNTGLGDISATVWKSLLSNDVTWPPLVASLRYSAPTGEDYGDDNVPLGDGFHQLTGRISMVKSVDPIAFFGDLAYTHYFDETILGEKVNRSDAIGVGAGVSLAATPEVSLSAELDLSFEDELKVDGVEVSGSDTTLGQVEVGVGVLLTRNVFLNLFGGFGITDDSPDFTLGISLPVRF